MPIFFLKPYLIDRPERPASNLLQAFYILLGVILFSVVSIFILEEAASSSLHGWKAVWRYREVFWHGWLETIVISVSALFLSTIFGVILAMARRSRVIALRAGALLFIEVVRGSPFLVQILFFFYVVAGAVGLNNRLSTGIFILSLFSSAYIAEIVRSGLEAVPKSQRESAKAIGLTSWQSYRYVIIPQAVRAILPSLAGQFASLIKDSSLLSIIGITEFTMAAQQVNSATYSTLESFFPLAVGYLFLTLPISLGSRWLESFLNPKT